MAASKLSKDAVPEAVMVERDILSPEELGEVDET